MAKHLASALFIFSEEGRDYIEQVRDNPHGTQITSVSIETLLANETEYLQTCGHVVVCGSLDVIKKVMSFGMEYNFSIGFVPLPAQKSFINCYGLPNNTAEAISLALSDDPKDFDVVFCNDQIVIFKASVGRIPLVDSPQNTGKARIIWNGLKKITSLRLLPFTITATGKNNATISTAASGCVVLANPDLSFASDLIGDDSSSFDELVSMVVVAPISIIAYLALMLRTLTGINTGSVPDSIGHIKSPQITLQSEVELSVTVDGEGATKTPVDCRVISDAIKINHGKDPAVENRRSAPGREKFVTKSLPSGKELEKARNKRIPFFTYASEDRFKDLFIALRDDARLTTSYLVLMTLSTILATVGLYMNSASVIIGAMLLAPLMAPIIALAMSVLRMDQGMFNMSLRKSVVGIVLALATGAIMTLLFPYQPLTAEMQGRLHPTTLDLIVAVVAGIAGAYTKSYKEILQSLAGVAIAVALVPPLATAGIGIGRMDAVFFGQAFLLFLTNFIGIVLAATFTFRILGFSPVVKGKTHLFVVCFFLVIVSIPLFMSYERITEKAAFEKSWKVERFMVNGKYLIVQDATLSRFHNNQVLTVEILARDQLSRSDLNVFKAKVGKNFSDDLIIRAKITYIP